MCLIKCMKWLLERLSLSLVRLYARRRRIVPNGSELSSQLLVYSVELGKGLLKLRRELPIGKVTMGMYVGVMMMALTVLCLESWNRLVQHRRSVALASIMRYLSMIILLRARRTSTDV